ncbi:MAG: hypothetical protein H7Z41_03805 [Cytophagales bacterium]|nr:hypothetical protein [Armatimonadota bacterium]
MGKIFGALLRVLFLLAILGLVGYNTWETARLRGEIESLKQRNAAATRPAGNGKAAAPVPNRDPAALLTDSRNHYEAAQKHLKRKEYAEASREMTLATEAAKKATENVGAISGSRLAEFQRTIQSLSDRAGTLWEQGRKSPQGAKPGADTSPIPVKR